MKPSFALVLALSGAAFAAPTVYVTDKSKPFKDLTDLEYSENLPVAEAAAGFQHREASKPVKDNRNLHYNVNSKMPIAASG
ncbi:hypothetical protein G3M48_000896 [Beauveria asiatica]|uniref:Uncharacterized protein n=1 Tax=Beauveria asiatica TaxID=1069075 RepID=A0AAW0RFY9_9HYPO